MPGRFTGGTTFHGSDVLRLNLTKIMQGMKVMWVAAGPAAFHSVIGTQDGRCYTWGRNEVRCFPGRLGQNLTRTEQ
jgi:alpha-tubulin suppressor-like RCC1 family protein